MQPLRQLDQALGTLADPEHCVFAPSDLAAAVPGCGQLAVLLSRATKAGLLKRVCRGIYLYPVPDYPAGSVLFHAAARLRAGEFNYMSLETVLIERLQTRYALPVNVSEPVKVGGKVSTWKLTIETRPGQKHLPAQRIHLDICAIPSHDPRPMMLRNLYGIDLGTSGLILQAQSREEILADKVIALAFLENRIKNRDLWDIAWLTQQGIELPTQLIPLKIRDHQHEEAEFVTLLTERTASLRTQPMIREDFMKEMRRFLPAATVRDTIEKEAYWSYLTDLVDDLGKKAMKALK